MKHTKKSANIDLLAQIARSDKRDLKPYVLGLQLGGFYPILCSGPSRRADRNPVMQKRPSPAPVALLGEIMDTGMLLNREFLDCPHPEHLIGL